jgi:hypothetical protein
MPTTPNYEADHFNNVEAFTKKIRNLYYAAIREAVVLGLSVSYNKDKPFSFSDYPALNKRVNDLFVTLAEKSLSTINSGTQHEWLFSAAKNDALVKSILDTSKLPREVVERYMDRNLDALNAFQNRKTAGMNLSDRIWKQGEQFKSELELAIDVGLGQGKSANALSQDIRQYLDKPDMLFRRVKDARGILHLSKAAKAYSPGQGTYRSSFKNAQRLVRNEINDAYRSSDYERWQKLDFVVGIRISLSNRHKIVDMCDDLKGVYAKDFKFRQWHVNCLCVATSIVATKDEIDKMTDLILEGKSTEGFKSVNQVKGVPDEFNKWISDNKERLLRQKSTSYFIADNFKDGNVTKGLQLAGQRNAK